MKKNTFIPEAMRGVCFECGARGHFGRDCPVRKANDGRRGKKRVRFNPEEDVQEAAEPDEGLEPRTAMDGDVDDDDDEDDDVPVRAMKDEIEGEENDTGERYNEVGERIEPFNLRAERANDGFFDANGNFVWKRGDAEPDAWLASMDEAAEEAAVGEALARSTKMEESDGDEEPSREPSELIVELISLLEPGETVASAVRRVGRLLKGDKSVRPTFERLTSAADALVRSGRGGVYEETREALEAAGKPPRLKAKPDDTRRWEYRAKDGKTYGPYTTQQILDWRAEGYFCGDGGVPMRLYSEPKAADDLAGDLEDSDDDAPAPEAKWLHSDDIDFLGDGGASPLP